MQQTTPEQIRAVQERTAKVLEPRTPAGSDAPAGKRWVSESAPRDGDRHFRAAATGPALFASQYFDVMLREAPAKSNNWAIWWSDLMMTMFIMFAALYAFQMPKDILPPKVVTAPLPPGESVVPPVPVDGESILVRTYDALRERVQAAGLEGVLAVRLIPEKAVRVTIAGDVLFDGAKTGLKASASRPLHVLADALRRSPYKITVIGHTDSTPSVSPALPTNWELSTARACGVGRFLIQDAGLAPDRLIMTGLGDQQPLMPNTSAVNMAANRRVELVVSVENPSDLPADAVEGAAVQDNVRHWLAKGHQTQGEGSWTEKR